MRSEVSIRINKYLGSIDWFWSACIKTQAALVQISFVFIYWADHFLAIITNFFSSIFSK